MRTLDSSMQIEMISFSLNLMGMLNTSGLRDEAWDLYSINEDTISSVRK